MQAALIAAVVALGLAGCGEAQRSPTDASDAAGRSDPAWYLKYDDQVVVEQPGPHEGTGTTTAYRYFDDVPAATLEFRKRAVHPGASIGLHDLTHDEVYYVLSGRGELTVNGERVEVRPGAAVYMRLGANVGLAQRGDEDLVIIIAYPPPR